MSGSTADLPPEARIRAAAEADDDASASALAAAEAEAVRRLLLHEVLLEEYATHRPPAVEPPAPAGPGGVARSLKQVFQPPLRAAAGGGPGRRMAEIERLNAEYRAAVARAEDDEARAAAENDYGPRILSRFFSHLAARQSEQAADVFDSLTRECSDRAQSDRGDEAATPGQRAAAEVFGLHDDYRASAARKLQERGTRLAEEASDKVDDEAEAMFCKYARQADGGGAEAKGGAPGGSNGGGAAENGAAAAFRKYFTPEEAKRAYARSLRSALCLSGGGIRSATFNLGILQGLARHGLLGQFDYLSTVSGGGFIGGWLTAWLSRASPAEVLRKLKEPPPSPVEPEAPPLYHLRVFGNYLSPRPGLMSADTWALGATVLRNLLLTWLVFLPLMAAALVLPRLWASVFAPGAWAPPPADVLGSALVMGWTALAYMGYKLSTPAGVKPPGSADHYKVRDKGFILGCLLPGLASLALLSVYFFRLPPADLPSLGSFVRYTALFLLIPWVICAVYRLLANEWSWTRLFRLAAATVLLGLAQAAAGALLYSVVTGALRPLAEASAGSAVFYASLSVPLLVLVLLLDFVLMAGLTSPFTKDADMEWWARAGAWFLIAATGWAAVHLIVLYGPPVLLGFAGAVRAVRDWDAGGQEWKHFASVLTVVGGVVSGAVTLVGGFSGRTPAADGEGRKGGGSGGLLGLLTTVLAPLFLAFIVALISLGTELLPPAGFGSYPAVMVALVVVGLFAGMLVNTNKFSLHFMWRDRIIRAYLGASRETRCPHPFTGFDEDDNVYMFELRDQPGEVRPVVERVRQALRGDDPVPQRRGDATAGAEGGDATAGAEAGDAAAGPPEAPPEVRALRRGKLFHVLNVALNLAGGDRLAWQDRKSESFTVTPLHAGSYWLGYRRSLSYGGPQGISLGTAVAISGAFVSPNMGYMMGSPVVRFLMTLFNVRFGWWLGNPGPAGDKSKRMETVLGWVHRLFGGTGGKPFQLKAPLLSARPIFEEAFGRTNDESPYVYLSDGGHFENLGLYEMVLRRCRFVVVSDASTDADYTFDSLAQSLRQIRVDLGVPVDLQEVSISPPSADMRGKYCAVGKIRYSCVDWKPLRDADGKLGPDPVDEHGLRAEDYDGVLIYVKASMIGGEPRDVVNYGRGSQSFPQEVIVDQWFTEAQFESYRALGSHIVDAICGGDSNQMTLAAFERKAREHNRVDFRVFKERISYAALASQFRRMMGEHTPSGYKEKVREYLDSILN